MIGVIEYGYDEYVSSTERIYQENNSVTLAEYQGNTTIQSNSTWQDYSSICESNAPDDFLLRLFHTCIYIMYSIIFIVALFGNGLVCFVVSSSPRMKTVTNYFIVNLAVGDILMTLFCIPFTFVPVLILRYWPFGSIMCKIVNFSQAVSVLVSAYTLLAISIDRYLVIMHPLRPRLGKAAAKMVVAGVWGGALATAAPIPIVSEVERPTDWHRVCQKDVCLEQWIQPEQSEQYTCALMALQFILPLSALVCTYARIAHVVWGVKPPGEAQRVRDSRMQRSKRKMIKMMVTVVVVFTVCWLPLNVFIILWSVHGNKTSWATWPGAPYVWFASHWLAMSHSCYNPIIYSYMNVRYRRGFRQALAWLLHRRKDNPSQSCHRYSMCEGMPMSELVGVNCVRRGTCSSSVSRLHRAPTCSSCASFRTVRAPGTNNKVIRSNVPVRALSVRTHFN